MQSDSRKSLFSFALIVLIILLAVLAIVFRPGQERYVPPERLNHVVVPAPLPDYTCDPDKEKCA